MTHQGEITVKTQGHGDMHDLTSPVREVVSRSKIHTGLVHVFHVGSTGAVGVIEFEPGLICDLSALMDRLMPPSCDYAHEKTWHDGNGHSHLQATILGPSVTVPIAGGELVLGTWQQIFLLECDIRARSRKVVITVIGD
jgi:secondary thiamine-phosphate synthase enzyme